MQGQYGIIAYVEDIMSVSHLVNDVAPTQLKGVYTMRIIVNFHPEGYYEKTIRIIHDTPGVVVLGIVAYEYSQVQKVVEETVITGTVLYAPVHNGVNNPLKFVETPGGQLTYDEVQRVVSAMLKDLPPNYPEHKLIVTPDGYWLTIGKITIYHKASAYEAIRHTANYIEARRNSPDLPVGVIYGIYD